MKNIIRKERDAIFSTVFSFICHIFILLFVLIQSDVLSAFFDNKIIAKQEIKPDDYIFLVETPDVEEEIIEDQESIFASDKNVIQKGLENVKPDIFITEDSTYSLNSLFESFSKSREDNNQTEIETYEPSETSTPQRPENKIPATFDEGADRAVVLSSETGAIQLGTKAQEYFWYFYSLVNAIRSSWMNTIPNQAHFLGLIRTDEVEVLLSIDEDGNIAFEKFLQKSSKEQISLDSSAEKAIEYSGKLKPPPAGLWRDYAENGRIYIPFRFIYQNFRRD